MVCLFQYIAFTLGIYYKVVARSLCYEDIGIFMRNVDKDYLMFSYELMH